MTEKKEIPRVLELGTMQEFLEMSDEDLKKAKTSGPLMAGMINTLWRAVCQLVDQRNKEAATVDAMIKELADWEKSYSTRDRPRDRD